MEKDLKDYLHLYLGCDMMNTYGQIHKLTFDNYETLLVFGKPILRPLSDMTEEEGEEIFIKDRYWDIVCDSHSGYYQPDEYTWLLKQGFDLFGLIEAGLAIDKTKIKHNGK